MAGNERSITVNIHETRSGNALVQAARDLEQLARGADVAGDKLAEAATDLEKLDVQMKQTQLRIKDLSAQIVRTGDTSLFADLSKEESNLRRLTRLAKNLAEEAGEQAGKTFMSSFGAALEGTPLKGPLIAVLVGAAVLATPLIGAVIGGALAGAIGTVGIAGGIAAAARSPEVRQAAGDLGDTFWAEVDRIGGSFTLVTVRALDVLRKALKDMDLAETFEKMAPAVTTIAEGFAAFGRNLMPGLNAAFDQMGPLADAAAEGIGEMGSAFGDFMEDVTAGEGARVGLQTFFVIVNGLIRGTGNTIRWLSDRWVDFNKIMLGAVNLAIVLSETTIGEKLIGDALKEDLIWAAEGIGYLIDGFDKVGVSAGPLRDSLAGSGVSAEEAAKNWAVLNHEFEKAIDLQTQLTFDTLDYADALDGLDEMVEKNGVTLADNTEKGRANQRGLLQIAEGARKMRDDFLELGGTTAGANAILEENKQKFLDQAEAAGFSRVEVEKLTAALFSVPALTKAQILLERYERNLSTGEHSGVGDSRDYRASGGPVTAGLSYIIGEQRPEVFTPQRSGYVHSSMGAYANAMGGGGSQTLDINIGGTPSNAIEAMFMEWLTSALSKKVRTRGNGNVQVALGGTRRF